MKKNQILALIAMLALTIGANAQIGINSSWLVGINNTSPAYRLDVNGNLRVADSGSRLIYQVTNCLGRYGQLHGAKSS